MQPVEARFIGVELYFDDLEKAKMFYEETVGLAVSDEQIGHHAQFDQRDSRSTCRSWVSSLATITPTGVWRSLASRISFLMSVSVIAALSLLSIRSCGSSGAPLGSR